ncbi:MAG: serine hydrolase [Halomonas sp.]|uniref:serine hydrolase domain-containing protein n=2 Tax=Halomonas TaxID=2745 RepID=UPI0017A93AE4|nr:serine hydrolase [Halomonas sp.]NWN83281.1 serine hydrolase [Halomonas sp.]
MLTSLPGYGLASSLLFVTSAFTSQALAQPQGQPLSAQDSDPVEMGWMQGFPPSKEHTLSAVDGSFFEFPALRWSVVHMRQFLPTVNVSRGLGAPNEFEYALDSGIDDVEFTPRGGDEPMTWQASLAENYTDGIMILHHGKPVYERYFAEMKEDRKHAAMSVTKSFTGILAATLVAEDKLDREAAVTDYVPELADSAFGDATVGQVMNMTTCLAYSEDYADPEAEIWDYAKASNPLPRAGSDNGPSGTFDYLKTLEKEPQCAHGDAFAYKTPNADALGWIVSRAADTSLAELLSTTIWSRLGMEQSAYYQVDAKGMPASGGGLSAGLRDMARVGQMLLDDGAWRGEQILPQAAIADMRAGGSQEAFARSDHPELEGWSYKDMWWMTHNDHGAFAARGVHGQTLYIDPTADMVIVRFASHPVAANAANDATSLPAYQAVADYLMDHDAAQEPSEGN